MRCSAGAILLGLLASFAGAEELARSPRPQPNPLFQMPSEAVPASVAVADGLESVPTPDLLARSLRPRARPLGLSATEVAEPEKTAEKPEKAAKAGSVCGVAAIRGEPIAPIKSKVKGCGLKDGVKVSSVSGVKLTPAPTIDCTTAQALNHWVEAVLQPAYGRGVVEIRIAAHYICRPRNNVRGAKISEHGRGKAVDVAGFVLKSGKLVTVVSDYDRTLRKVHKGACGIFGTTLGPGSDGYHEDHLHFDTASYRGGPYCR